MRRAVLALLVFCCILPAQTKKVIANLSPEMLKELAVSAPNVRIVSARGVDLAKEIEDADAMVGVTLTPELFKHARQLKWLHISSAGVESHGRPDRSVSGIGGEQRSGDQREECLRSADCRSRIRLSAGADSEIECDRFRGSNWKNGPPGAKGCSS